MPHYSLCLNNKFSCVSVPVSLILQKKKVFCHTQQFYQHKFCASTLQFKQKKLNKFNEKININKKY